MDNQEVNNSKTLEQQALEKYAQLAFANIKKSMVQDLVNNRNESVIYKRYPIERVVTMLEKPQSFEKELREMSNFLYITSSHYRRLMDYYAKLPTYNHIVVPTNLPKKINTKTYKDTYYKVIAQIEKYNLKHELPKILLSAFVEGVFYGLEYETSDSYYIKPFNSNFAEISSIEDGCYSFSIDLNYFTGKEHLFPAYGKEIENAYYAYKGYSKKKIKGNTNLRWFEPSNGICIKADENNPLFSTPVYCSIFLDLIRLEDYKLLKKAKTEIDNYKVLALKMEVDDDGVPKMDFDMAMKYYNQAAGNLPSGIGLILSPFVISDFSFQKSSSADTDAVNEAEEEFWSSSGTSGMLFGSAKASSSSSLTLSTKPDEQIAFSILTQIARNINRKIKKMNLPYTFELKFLDQSIFNVDEYSNRMLKASQYGVSGSKLLYAASLGMTPSDVVNFSYLENDILKVTNEMFTSPLISSNTISRSEDNVGGASTQEEKGQTVSDNTEKSREQNGNNEN
ncbi:MAG: phage protein [Anaerocolumna sp.]|jgi:hypothetical protein|nr:phage protein [Anaerocolumna sp.]